MAHARLVPMPDVRTSVSGVVGGIFTGLGGERRGSFAPTKSAKKFGPQVCLAFLDPCTVAFRVFPSRSGLGNNPFGCLADYRMWPAVLQL